MSEIIEMCEELFDELSKFSDDVLYLGPPINDNRLDQFAKEIGFKLPYDFEYILKKHNGIALLGTQIYGLDKQLRGSSIDKVYEFEHHEANYRMPLEFLPFSPDGRGNHYCLNLSKLTDEQCPVVFWQWDLDYDFNEVEECNITFVDWVKEVMIEWKSDDYNYDGTEK